MTRILDLSAASSARLDEAALSQVRGGDGAILCEIGARVEHAIKSGSWKAFFEPFGPLASIPKKK